MDEGNTNLAAGEADRDDAEFIRLGQEPLRDGRRRGHDASTAILADVLEWSVSRQCRDENE